MPAKIIEKVHYFPRLDSTNLEALRCIKMKKYCPRLIVAHEQSQGRGQYGRTWFSPKGNLYLSFTELIQRTPQEQPLLAGVVVASALQQFVRTNLVSLKFPNDVLIDNKKVCGILIDRLEPYYVVGVGMNVISSPLIQHYETTHIRRYAPDISLGMLVRAFLKHHQIWSAKSFEEINLKWLELADREKLLTDEGFYLDYLDDEAV